MSTYTNPKSLSRFPLSLNVLNLKWLVYQPCTRMLTICNSFFHKNYILITSYEMFNPCSTLRPAYGLKAKQCKGEANKTIAGLQKQSYLRWNHLRITHEVFLLCREALVLLGMGWLLFYAVCSGNSAITRELADIADLLWECFKSSKQIQSVLFHVMCCI